MDRWTKPIFFPLAYACGVKPYVSHKRKGGAWGHRGTYIGESGA